MNRGVFQSIGVLALSVLFLTSCYDEFDPDSYKPEFSVSGFSSVSQIKSSNLVAYWAFEGALADSVSGISAENNGGTFNNGFLGKALFLNVEETAYVTAAPTASTTTGLQSFTISFWVNPTFKDNNGDGTIDGILGLVSLANTERFWGNINFFVENGSSPSAATVKVQITSDVNELWLTKSNVANFFGNWSNHTITYNAANSEANYYLNGSVVFSTTSGAWSGPANFTKSGPWVFGCVHFQTIPSSTSATGQQDWASYLTGYLDEVRVYNTALTAVEVNAMVVLQGKGK